MTDIAIQAEGLSKLYHIGGVQKKYDRVGEQLTDLQVQPDEVFRFADSPTVREHMEAYRANTALVNPRIFAREIMKLRQQLHKRHQEAGS